MNNKRRLVLKGTVAAGSVGMAVGAGLLTPNTAMAAWSEKAFKANSVKDALADLGMGDTGAESADITIKAPDIAENGSVVPVTVSTTMDNVERITIFVENNNTPLTSSYDMTAASVGFVATRVKMSKTSNVVAVVTAGGKNFSAKKEVKVTIGGCGG